MEQTKTTTEQKLMRTLMQFNKMSWHQQPVAGCKPSEVRVLFCIKKGRNPHSPEMKVSEISKCLHVTSPTITQALKSLEANGLIERHIDPIDRRAIGVILTEKGEQVVQQAIDEFLASTRGLIDYLGEEQTNQLIDLLSSMFRYFHEREASKSYASWNGEEEA